MSYASVVLADNPIRYCRLGDASGTVAIDAGSQAQNGTIQNAGTGVTLNQAGLLIGDANPSMLFTPASSGYITLPMTGLPTGAAAWTMEAWVKMPATVPTTGYQTIMGFGSVTGTNSIFLFYHGASNYFCCSDWAADLIHSSLAATANAIYSIAATYDGTTITFYVNGVSIGTSTLALTIGTTFAQIGNDTAGDYWSGSIQEVAFYSTALSPMQVAAHYLAGTTAPVVLLKPRYSPRAFGATLIPDRVSQPLAYIQRAFGSTILYESRTFLPRALGGVYLPDTVMWVPRALVGTEQAALLRSLTLAGVGALTPTLAATTALAGTCAGSGQLAGTAQLATALTITSPGVGTLVPTLSAALTLPSVTLSGAGTCAGTLTETTALTTTMNGASTFTGTMTLATSLTATMAGSGQLAGTLSAQTALGSTLTGAGTLSGAIAAATALTTALSGTGTLVGVFSLQTALGGTSAAAGALSGVMAAHTALFLTCAGAGTLAGQLVILGGLAATCAGVGTLAGTVSYPGTSATATWVTRDHRATWVTRDLRATWVTRDDKATWNTRR